MSLEESPRTFKPIPKAEESKEELESFYHDPAQQDNLTSSASITADCSRPKGTAYCCS